MDYEKKYKEALGRAREFQKSKDGLCVLTAESIFPELQESEDERIRKAIISVFTGKSSFTSKEEANKYIAWLEKQGKQKPTDKVEPKFHEGDWIIDKQGIVHQIEKVIENVTNNTFGYDLVGGGYFNEEVKSYRLWTIADAKDGNVLYSLDSNRPFIYKERNGYEQATAYCGLNIYGKFFVWGTKDCVITLSNYVPATKEQRDTLLKAMADAGYTFNFDKKELKKIEQKPVNDTVETIVETVSNTSILDMIEDKDAFTNPGVFENSLGRLLKLFEKLPKQDLLDGLKFYTNVVEHDGEYVKPTAWSEEDETGLTNTIIMLKEGASLHFNKKDITKDVEWLKSLKERLS